LGKSYRLAENLFLFAISAAFIMVERGGEVGGQLAANLAVNYFPGK